MAAQTSTTPTGDRQPVVACQSLTRVFKDFWMRARARAVDNVSFQIAPGEVFGLLGPNGSGKSTTIKMILGLLKPTRGRIAVFGKPPTDVQVKSRIGYLPEESYLYPFLNARETLDYYGKLFQLDAGTRARRTDELLEMVGLTHAQHRQVREYSKGMQRRIGIAQALINDPDFLILDEPTTGLDPLGTRQVKDLILELGRRGKTVLLSSHLLADVQDCVDRMVILYGGQIRDEGTCDDLLSAHDRTSIETDELDEETIREIDELIRRRTGGAKSVRRVDHPRQTLEQKFLDIVERARSERLTTSGATSGGQTASFLSSGAAAEGEELVSSLIDDGSTPPEPSAHEVAKAAPREPSDNVLDSLVDTTPDSKPESEAPRPTPTPDAAPRSAPAEPPRPSEPPSDDAGPDDDVIGSLLDPGEERTP